MLPQTKHPLFETKIPSVDKIVSFRQMLVRDEKILLMAKSSEDEGDIFRAVKQVVNNCMFESNIDSLTTFDLEWMFLKIRSASIGNVVELSFLDKEDNEEYTFEVNLDEVEIKYPENVNPLIEKEDGTALFLRYPPSSLFDEEKALSDGVDSYEYIASRCIEKIFDGDETYLAEDCTPEELLEYIEGMDLKSYKRVKEFISSTPHLNYIIEYKNSKGTERKIPLTSLTDFFMLR